jgi:hypothetical protein
LAWVDGGWVSGGGGAEVGFGFGGIGLLDCELTEEGLGAAEGGIGSWDGL